MLQFHLKYTFKFFKTCTSRSQFHYIAISFRYDVFAVPVKGLYQAELKSLHVMQQVRIETT